MGYVITSVEVDGQIRALGCKVRDVYYSDPNRIVHRESRGIDTWGTTCYDTLVSAKASRAKPRGGRDTAENRVVLALDKEGGVSAIWTLPSQQKLIRERLSRWKGCYGLWSLRTFNA